jgi:release factor glutamine methyltransferase
MIKTFIEALFKPIIIKYLKKERRFKYKGFSLKVYPGVFHPGFFFSTKILFKFLSSMEMEGKHFLEVGCGSGLISLLAVSKNAVVTALDINPLAVKNTLENYQLNQKNFNKKINVIESDLFIKLEKFDYDIIVVNPPYFFKDARIIEEHAWYCGQNGEYFDKFFFQLKNYRSRKTLIYMILSDGCELERISLTAAKNGFSLSCIFEKNIIWEKNYIFKIEQVLN